ncbi:MAG: MBOAT family protein [Flavobacteriales bacterium]|nr:MBOAT family protein [Flavobacteriales bacterium]MCB9447541.1 MBOAT family protein [Flavobacteriales bacterium]
MLFNSIEFIFFLGLVFALYWGVFSHHKTARNTFLLVVSYIFYGWWDWRFLALIAFSSLVDFFVGLALSRTERQSERKWLLALSLVTNIGLLGMFKYYNFFVHELVRALGQLGVHTGDWSLQLILPVGISFYTFQTLSYSIDVYRRKLPATKDVVTFLAYVSFFPQLVAGPIERAEHLLPQFERQKKFNYAESVDGLRLMLWGFFKKVVVADQLSVDVDHVFGAYSSAHGSVLFLGAVYFAFQIYCDFSGYSDIAIGTARLFGFDLMQNFRYPYFSRDIAEFWRRWHISLSTWFRDYVYIPLGGSKGSKGNQIRNIFIIFLVSGFWHGANWTFIAWGGINALYFLPLMMLNVNRHHQGGICEGKVFPDMRTFALISVTFVLTVVAWVFFRAQSIGDAFGYLNRMCSSSLLSVPDSPLIRKGLLGWIGILVGAEWLQRNRVHPLRIDQLPIWVRWLVYVILAILVFAFFSKERSFIYFQF